MVTTAYLVTHPTIDGLFYAGTSDPLTPSDTGVSWAWKESAYVFRTKREAMRVRKHVNGGIMLTVRTVVASELGVPR